MKEAYKQKPFIKPPRISFWDNIFYWSWYSTKHGLPHRTFATVTVMQYVYVVLFTAVILNCLDSQTGICIFSTSQRGYWAISLFRLSY